MFSAFFFNLELPILGGVIAVALLAVAFGAVVCVASAVVLKPKTTILLRE